jgi:Ca2+-binding RTX toxin-like protein
VKPATLLLVLFVFLSAAAPARAGVLEVSQITNAITYSDPAGVPDDLRVEWRDSAQPVTVFGATVTAGRGCVAVAGGASCPAGDDGFVFMNVGGGDDSVTVSTLAGVFLDGGDGDDRLTLALSGVDHSNLSGEEGDDVLVTAERAVLEGGPGNDRLSAGAPSGLSGGSGDDRLEGSPGADVLVDAGDRRSRDAIVCGGGDDLIHRDRGDVRSGCNRAALDNLSWVSWFWRVRERPQVSVPTRLRVKRFANYSWLDSYPFATCLGAACHGARFGRVGGLGDPSFGIVSGGKRARVNGRMRRGVGPGAIVRVGLWLSFGDVVLTKGFDFRTRAGELPIARKRCTVADADRVDLPDLYDAPRGGRVVPCD